MDNLQKHWFNTGVNFYKYPRKLQEHEEVIGGTLRIAFYTDPVPTGAVFMHAQLKMPNVREGYIIREIKGGGLLSKYAVFQYKIRKS